MSPRIVFVIYMDVKVTYGVNYHEMEYDPLFNRPPFSTYIVS